MEGQDLDPIDVEDGEAGLAVEPDALRAIGRETDLIESVGRRTDVGFGRIILKRHSADLRYVTAWKKWLVWTGSAWAIDKTNEVVRCAIETHHWMHASMREMGRIPPDPGDAVASWVVSTGNASRIRSAIDMASTDHSVVVTPDDVDRDPWLLGLGNGTLDLRTGEVRSPDRADLITKVSPVDYDPEATAPQWSAFLERVVPDEDVRSFLQRAAGYSLTGSTREHALFYLWGRGANGKTTFLNVLTDLLGDYGGQAAPGLVEAKRWDGHPTDLADIQGKRLVVASEVDGGRQLAEARVKQLTGGDRVKARRMREDFWEFTPTCKFWIAANYRLEVRGSDEGIWRRLHLVPFTVSIPKEEQDHDLTNKLRSELPGILNWAIKGCTAWQRDGLLPPESVTLATEQYRLDSDPVSRFIGDWFDESATDWVPAKMLHLYYDVWRRRHGEPELTARALGTRLRERGLQQKKIAGTRGWLGLRLRHDENSWARVVMLAS